MKKVLPGLLIVLAFVPMACSQSAPDKPVYGTRGIVAQKNPGAEPSLAVLHEAIPGFRNQAGEVTGMNVMIMTFAVDDHISLDGIESGVKIAFDFAVDWSASPRIKIVRLEKLPADTALDLDGYSLE